MSGLDLSFGGIGFRGGGGGGGTVVGPLDHGNDRSSTNSPSSCFGSGGGSGCLGGGGWLGGGSNGYTSFGNINNTATTNNDGCFWSFTSLPPRQTSLHRDDTTTTIISDSSGGNNSNNIDYNNVVTDTNSLSSWSQFQLRKLWGSGSSSGSSRQQHDHRNQQQHAAAVVVVDGDEKKTNASTNLRPISVTDDELAIALNSLSFQQREIVYNDIHGINESYKQEEDPQMINTCLQEMKQRLLEQVVKFGAGNNNNNNRDEAMTTALPSLSTTSTSTASFALKEAIEQNSNYVMNKKFLLSFLRADEYNVDLACKRIINFFQYKRELFGSSSLTQEITLHEHFNDDDMHCLLSGGFQYAPLQDRSGRHIPVNIPSLESYNVHENMLRTGYYVYMAISKDSDRVQKQGLCEIAYDIVGERERDKKDLQLLRKMFKLRAAIPIKTSATHFVTDNPLVHVLVKFTAPFWDLHSISRTRVHVGGHLHCQYELTSFGIPVEALPIDLRTGQYNNRSQKLWVQHRIEVEKREAVEAVPAPAATQQQEGSMAVSPSLGAEMVEEKPALVERDFNSEVDKQTKQHGVPSSTTSNPAAETSTDGSTKTTYILQPKPTDVIIGRGRPIDQHAGNVQFRKYLQSQDVLQEYIDTPKFLKFQNAEKVRCTLCEQHNVRFLRESTDGKGWYEVDRAAVREKILRTFRRILSHQQQHKKA